MTCFVARQEQVTSDSVWLFLYRHAAAIFYFLHLSYRLPSLL